MFLHTNSEEVKQLESFGNIEKGRRSCKIIKPGLITAGIAEVVELADT